MSPATQRVVGVVVLLVTGILSIPVSAYVFDNQGVENWIVPVQLALMALTGATLAVALPALARDGASTARRALTGAWWGLLAAFVGVVVLWLMLNGLPAA